MSKVDRWVDKEDRRDGSLFGSPHIPLAPGSPLPVLYFREPMFLSKED